jgi:hypothetical protein
MKYLLAFLLLAPVLHGEELITNNIIHVTATVGYDWNSVDTPKRFKFILRGLKDKTEQLNNKHSAILETFGLPAIVYSDSNDKNIVLRSYDIETKGKGWEEVFDICKSILAIEKTAITITELRALTPDIIYANQIEGANKLHTLADKIISPFGLRLGQLTKLICDQQKLNFAPTLPNHLKGQVTASIEEQYLVFQAWLKVLDPPPEPKPELPNEVRPR